MSEEKIDQILKNQIIIMEVLRDVVTDYTRYISDLNKYRKETYNLLNPPQEQSLSDRTKDALQKGDE